MPEPLTCCSWFKGSFLSALCLWKKLIQSHGDPFLSRYLLALLTCFSKTTSLLNWQLFQDLAWGWGAALDFVSKYAKINCIQCIFYHLKLPQEWAIFKSKHKLNLPILKKKSKTKPENLLTCFLPAFWFCIGQDGLNQDQNQTRASHSNGGKQDTTLILPETPGLKIVALQFIGKLLVMIFLALRCLPREWGSLDSIQKSAPNSSPKRHFFH